MSNQTLYDLQRKKRWGKGKILTSFCSHGIQRIKDSKKFDFCPICDSKKRKAPAVDAKLHFNYTLQREFGSFHESDKWAKKRGLACIGSERFDQIAKERWPDHPLTQSIQGIC